MVKIKRDYETEIKALKAEKQLRDKNRKAAEILPNKKY